MNPSPSTPTRPTEQELLGTFFDLGRQVTAVLDFEELLQKIPELIARISVFDAFAVYLLDEKRGLLSIAYSVGYPEAVVRTFKLRVGQGLVGTAVAEKRCLLVNDVLADERYAGLVPDIRSALIVPLLYQKKVIGALNILSRNTGQFTETDEAVLRQFGAHVAVALANARLFERERRDAAAFETLAEIGREVTSILDLDQLLTRIVHLAKRLIDYRTFGIWLLNEKGDELEIRQAIKYGEHTALPKVKLGEGLVGHAALTGQVVLVPDVSEDPRYLRIVEDVRSELVIPMLFQERCIGVLDLESPEVDVFDKRDVEILTLLASQAAVAIENARLYEAVRANEVRLEKEMRFAQRVQMALLPGRPPKRQRGVDVAVRFAPAYELGGDFYDFLVPETQSLVVAVGDVSGKGAPAALYSAFAGELVRSRTFRRRYQPERSGPSAVLEAINTILYERQLEHYYCTLCYASFDLRRRTLVMANSGLPYPVCCSGSSCAQIEMPGVPLGALAGSSYDDVSFPLATGDLFVFCTDGIFEATDAHGREFSAERLLDVISRSRDLPAQRVVDEILEAVRVFRGDAPVNDDMTAVAVKVTI